jgi:hypothetical protein
MVSFPAACCGGVYFENAQYHVMNRSVSGRSILSSPQCYQAFLDILGEAGTIK